MDQQITYSVRKSRRARRPRISVSRDMAVTVVLPFGFSDSWAQNFVNRKFAWIKKSLEYFQKFSGKPAIKTSRRDYLAKRNQALDMAKQKVGQWSAFYGFSYKAVKIKNQKTRWGSCSKKGNLNFNYKIVYLPEKLLDYLVVHELCHLKELNHSKNFWQLVSRAVLDYKELRKRLRNFEITKA